MGITQRDAATPPLILLVDPDPDTREMYVAGLRHTGWIVDAVTDGREALAKAISYQPAAIVTETRVPRLDGLDLCRLLRMDPDTRHIPILFVTADADAKRIAAAERAGADRVLTKPCLPNDLACVIEAILGTARDQRQPRLAPARNAALKPMARVLMSRHYERGETTTPPSRPPDLLCPRCDQPLSYLKSYVGGVSAKHREQWDHYECSSGCGRYQYRQRTRKLRDMS